MAEIKNTFLKGKMNQDLDSRILPNGEYREAINLALSRSEGDTVGEFENILGNSRVDSAAIDIANKIIGYCVDQSTSSVYFFRTNYHGASIAPSTSLCQISVYNSGNNSINVLVEGAWLNFSSLNPILGVNLIEKLLFFTDNRNQPRKINVEQDSSYYTNEDQISVAKFAPINPPEYINLRANLIDSYNPSTTLFPSTMTNKAALETVLVGTQEISASNLSVTKYANGDAILEAKSLANWTAADSAGTGCFTYYDSSLGNEVTYGILYNKHAAIDPRGLAPTGYTVLSQADWNQIISTGGTAASAYKSTTLWDNPPTINTNTTGLDIRPAGIREAASASSDFSGITTESRFWTSDAISGGSAVYTHFPNTDATPTTASTATSIQGYSVRVKKDANGPGWNGDPELLRDKFVKFSYRFKFDDNEYSVIAPFSQDVFIPQQEGQFVNDDETKAFVTTVVEFMQNSINNAVLNIKLPCIDIINEYKIKSLEIVFSESDKTSYQVLEKVNVNSDFTASLNNTNIYQYNYQSTKPIKTLPSFETTRVYDKVPVRALAQESSGNRILYSNFVEGYTAPSGLDYYVSVDEKDTQQFIEYPQHSLKQNRNYQVGVVLADKYGRQTDIILSNYDGLLDILGNPQPGSNVYSDYKTLQFTTFVDAWRGDSLTLNYQQTIPELTNYAQGSYYSVNTDATTGALNPFFESDSYQYFTSAGAANFLSVLNYADSQAAANTLNVFVNEGNGWILKELTTDYAVVNTAGKVQINFGANITSGFNVKIEILFTAENLYKYRTGAGSTTRPLFVNFDTTYTNYYAPGRKLSGQYIDYTEIVSVTPNADPATSITFTTKQEVEISYLFSSPGTTNRPEPALPANIIKTFGTYNINVNGFYSYKLGVKQQQQDYYNVYLPGIVNGYPIKNSDLEQGEIAFTTLISDNINKLPRNLQDVGPLQNQFTSDVTMFPRVSNIVAVNAAAPAVAGSFSTRNTQFDPASTSDSVDLVGTIADVFPDSISTSTVASGDVNPFSIYDFDTRPYVAKISTQKPIGLTEDKYFAAAPTAPQLYPYPNNLGLAVYETSPFVSQLQLFYETSSTELISALNIDIQNESTEINGSTFSNVAVAFSENDAVGTILTGDFFPTIGGQIVTNAACEILDVFSSSPTSGSLDTSINYKTRFAIATGGVTGSFHIKTAAQGSDPTGFYAGGASDPLYDVSTRGKFEITLRWTRAGITTDEVVTIQLQNDSPEIINIPQPFEMASTETNICMIIGAFFGVPDSPFGKNGSSAEPSAPRGTVNTTNPANGDWAVFDTSTGFGWTLEGARFTNTLGTQTYYGSYPGAPAGTAVSNIASITAQSIWQGYLRFNLVGVDGVCNATGAYSYSLKLTDNLGSTQSTTVDYTVGLDSFFGQVVEASYASGTGYVANSDFNLDTGNQTGLPIWQGQIQNWTTNDVWIWMRVVNEFQQNNVAFYPVFTTIKSFGTAAKLGDGTIGSLSPTGAGDYGVALNETKTHTSTFAVPVIFSDWVLVARLKAFNPTTAQIAANVVPGQKNSGGTLGTYDFQQSAIVNAKFEVTSHSGPTDGRGQMAYSITSSPPATIPFGYDITPSPNVTPPFHPISGASSVFPTSVPLANGPSS